MTSFYVYEDETKTATHWQVPSQEDSRPMSSLSNVSSNSATSDNLTVSVTDSSSDDDDMVTLPTAETFDSVINAGALYSKDAVARFNRKVKLKAQEETKLMRKLRKIATQKATSVNYISDTSSSSSSTDSFDSVGSRRGVEHLLAGSPMWGSTMHKSNRTNACVPCETAIDPRVFSPAVSKLQPQPENGSISIFDAKGRVMDMQFDNECKFLQCFDDVDLL